MRKHWNDGSYGWRSQYCTVPGATHRIEEMKHIEVALHRVAVGGSIRLVIDGGRPMYLKTGKCATG